MADAQDQSPKTLEFFSYFVRVGDALKSPHVVTDRTPEGAALQALTKFGGGYPDCLVYVNEVVPATGDLGDTHRFRIVNVSFHIEPEE